jgi:hypothetical protein
MKSVLDIAFKEITKRDKQNKKLPISPSVQLLFGTFMTHKRSWQQAEKNRNGHQSGLE